MQLRFQECDDFVVFFKPNGFRMHQVDKGQYGFVEAVSEELKIPLFVVHRLDKETSGVVILAKSPGAANDLSALFKSQQVAKTYFFLTDQKTKSKEFSVKSLIEKRQNHFVSQESNLPNAETKLAFVKQVGNFYLWQAQPKSGKTHQIRLHAKQCGIPILGDALYGGHLWYRLALHAAELNFVLHNKKYNFLSELPPSFSDSEIDNDYGDLKNFLHDSLFNLKQLFHKADTASCRLFQSDFYNLNADIFGTHLWVYDYSDQGINSHQTKIIQDFANANNFNLVIRHMLNRGAGVGGQESATLKQSVNETSWNAEEEKICYHLRTDTGFSPGLFLDQKNNRKWVLQNSKEKEILNLFSYTGGFSINAAIGKGKSVTTVDVSKRFLEWSKENFKINNLNPQHYEFFAQDVLLFLKGSRKRKRDWDLIICDPPSFGRSQDSLWRIEKDIADLALLLWPCLKANGQILMTCNFEKWTLQDLINEFTKKLKPQTFAIKPIPLLSLDMGETDELKNLMKGFLICKTTL